MTCPVSTPYWLGQLEELIEQHASETGSQIAQNILQYWDVERGNFVQVCPKEMLDKLEHPLGLEEGAIPAE